MVTDPAARWLNRLERTGPLYLALVRALEEAIRDGELQAGDRLPPQRTVAELIGVDFTTVTRAYAAARRRGLIEGAVGRGTFVRREATDDEGGLVTDLTMNLPPPPDGVSLGDLLRETTAAVLARADAATLMTYHPGAGGYAQRAAGAAWLQPGLGDLAPERVLVSPGAQTALVAALSAICAPGDTVLAEPLTYPGIKAACAHLSLRLVACAAEPEALALACRTHAPKALYVIPTLQNPTATTLDLATRRAIAALAGREGLWIIEDDPYSRLMDAPPLALASLAPDRTFHIATLSKCLSPGLRTAFLVPPPSLTDQTAERLRAVALMPAPLMTAVVTRWIREGAAEALLSGVRREARARRAAVADLLPQAQGGADSVHVWLDLDKRWSSQAVKLAAQQRGLSLVTAEAFATGAKHRGGMRISLGGPSKRQVLIDAVGRVAQLIQTSPSGTLTVG